MANINNELIELIKKEISGDTELCAKAHLLCQRGLSIKEFDELDRQDKNFYIASLIYCKEEEAKNQVALAKASNPFLKTTPIYNITVGEVKSDSAEELIESLQKIQNNKPKNVKEHIKDVHRDMTEIKNLEVILIPIMNKDNITVKDYDGIVKFKLAEDYKNIKLPKTFNIQGFIDDDSIYIENCRIKKYDFTTDKYEAEFNVKDIIIENKKEDYSIESSESYLIPTDKVCNTNNGEKILSRFVKSAYNSLKKDNQYNIAYGRKSKNSPVYFSIKDKDGEEVNIMVDLY